MNSTTSMALMSMISLCATAARAQNIVPNPSFVGTGGAVVPIAGTVNGTVPDNWRAFAVNGGAIDIEIQTLAADELFAGSPATNAILMRVNAFGADQGFDDDNGRFPLIPGLDYHAELYVKSGNTDSTDQSFNFGFPLFDKNQIYLGIESGGQLGSIATQEWTLFKGPTFTPDNRVAFGHISWRCIGDGGEDSIVIALPFIQPEGELKFPSNLVCTKIETDVSLAWDNNANYSSLKVLRDDVEIATLDLKALSYTDLEVPEGLHRYQVLATIGAESNGPTCEVSIFAPPDDGTTASVDLGDVNTDKGMTNTVNGDGGDGENGFVICGPEGDPREARSNYGAEDPTPDFPDSVIYFTVTDPAMKAQDAFRLEVTAYDDPALAGTSIYLQYNNLDSQGPGDIPNTFFPLDGSFTNTLAGTGEWVVLTWEITNAGFRGFQQGVADFRLGITNGARVCLDRVDLVFGQKPVEDFFFHRGDADDNGDLQLTDAVRILGVLFLGQGTIPCADAADADDNGVVQLTDAVRILGVLFLGQGTIPAPGPTTEPCGADPTDDELLNKDCAYTHCTG